MKYVFFAFTPCLLIAVVAIQIFNEEKTNCRFFYDEIYGLESGYRFPAKITIKIEPIAKNEYTKQMCTKRIHTQKKNRINLIQFAIEMVQVTNIAIQMR